MTKPASVRAGRAKKNEQSSLFLLTGELCSPILNLSDGMVPNDEPKGGDAQ